MSVQIIDEHFGVNGHAKSIAAFRNAHIQNSEGILNAAEGLPVDTPRPEYDPGDHDNHWPIMLHHPEKGELSVGVNLKGLPDVQKAAAHKANHAAKAAALAAGYREEPYAKPQVAVMDPAAAEKRYQEDMARLQGQLTAQNDLIAKLLAGQGTVQVPVPVQAPTVAKK